MEKYRVTVTNRWFGSPCYDAEKLIKYIQLDSRPTVENARELVRELGFTPKCDDSNDYTDGIGTTVRIVPAIPGAEEAWIDITDWF